MKLRTVLPDGKIVVTEGTGEAYQSGVFDGIHELDTDRYAIEEDALRGHADLCAKWEVSSGGDD